MTVLKHPTGPIPSVSGQSGKYLTTNGSNLSWGTLSGSMTQIASGTFSGASVIIDNIPGTYKNLQLVVRNYLPATDNTSLNLRFNNDSTASRHRIFASNSASYAAQTFNSTSISITNGDDNGVANGLSITDIYDYANATTWKMLTTTAIGNNATSTNQFNAIFGQGFYNQTAAITRLDLFPQSGNFTSGDYILYGVN